MDGSVDVYTIIFLALAVFVFFWLRSVLGRRTGNERPPFEPYQRSDPSQKAPAQVEDKVVAMPRRNDGTSTAGTTYATAGTSERAVDDFAPPSSPLHAGLMDIARADATFDPRAFLTGAKAAYELIVMAFANGDRKALKPLLAKDVYEGFVKAISDREGRGEVVETKFVGIDQADIVEAECKQRSAQVTVKFVSQLITAIRSKAGEVVEGDPSKVSELTDIWTFARDVSSRDPNWKLVATQAAN